jgi:endonuclease/exonuclease/phosphatase (EEP) superfamily protein YafD
VALVVVNIHYEVIPVHLFSGSSNGHSVRVLAYNVHSQADCFGAAAPKMSAMILEEKPDFVYLTEYYEGTDEKLQDALEKHYPYVNRKHRWGANDGDAFYSTWEIDSVQRFKLAAHFSAIFRVKIHKGIDTLAVYCCHLSSNNLKLKEGRWASMEAGRKLRCKEADVIVDALKNERYPAIVMGDMNDFSYVEPIKRIEKAGMRDAWWNGGTGYGSTYNEGKLWLRIDHILYNKQQMKLRNISVVGDYEWSDHRALVADFALAN